MTKEKLILAYSGGLDTSVAIAWLKKDYDVIAVSGEMHGPELPDTIYLLGREKSIQHLENMLETIQ